MGRFTTLLINKTAPPVKLELQTTMSHIRRYLLSLSG